MPSLYSCHHQRSLTIAVPISELQGKYWHRDTEVYWFPTCCLRPAFQLSPPPPRTSNSAGSGVGRGGPEMDRQNLSCLRRAGESRRQECRMLWNKSSCNPYAGSVLVSNLSSPLINCRMNHQADMLLACPLRIEQVGQHQTRPIANVPRSPRHGLRDRSSISRPAGTTGPNLNNQLLQLSLYLRAGALGVLSGIGQPRGKRVGVVGCC